MNTIRSDGERPVAPVVIVAGGTGGHVFPALVVARCLIEQGVPVIWLGTRRGLEARLAPEQGIPIHWLSVSGLRGKSWWRLSTAPLMLLRALWQAGIILRRVRPRAVLGMGGFVSGPGAVAARCLRIPLIIHEQNAVAGTTNRWLAKFADQVLEAFPDSFHDGFHHSFHHRFQHRRAVTVGNPVRKEIAAIIAPGERFASRWQNNSSSRRLLILGGSQGASALNRQLPPALARLPSQPPLEIWHQTGTHSDEIARTAYRQAGIEARLSVFIDDMAAAYQWADLVICRAGALTVAEICAAGIGSVLIPFPYAIDDHQTANARYLERSGAALVWPEQDLSAELIARRLTELLADRQRLLTMAQAARRLACVDAAETVVTFCLAQSAKKISSTGRVKRC